MVGINSSRWLSTGEASALLQGFMPNKMADAWLDNDRKFDPVIPFRYVDGEVRYRSLDLEQFVRRCLASGVKIDFSERRRRRDRRYSIERRKNPEVRLIPAAERRSASSFDRRAGQRSDRRSA